jgi:hypothetical protein
VATNEGPTISGSSEQGVTDLDGKQVRRSAAQQFLGAIGNFWQLITAVVGIVTLMVTELTYFATRDQLNQLDCLNHVSLTMTTAPIERDELTIQSWPW